MKNLFVKSFVVPFYKAFFGFFVLLFITLGLLMEVRQHMMVGDRILQHPTALALLLLLFIFYGSVQYRFHIKLIQKPKYHVFQQMALFKASDFSVLQLRVWVYNHLFILVYAAFLTFLSIRFGMVVQPLIIWAVLAGMYLAHRNLLYYALRNPFPDQRPTVLRKFSRRKFLIGRTYWLIIHLKENRLLLLLASKAIALILLKLFFYSFSSGAYDVRWLHFGVLCATYINLPIWLEKKDFESNQLKTFLNMPLSLVKKGWYHFYSTLQIVAPEILYIVLQYPALSDIRQLLSLLMMILSLNLGMIALINFTKEASELPRNVIITFFSLFLLIIFGFHSGFMSIIVLSIFLLSIRSPYAH